MRRLGRMRVADVRVRLDMRGLSWICEGWICVFM